MAAPIVSKGINLSAGRLFLIAKSAYERIQTVCSPTSGNQDDALVSIVFSAASIEAFFNELPEVASLIPETLKLEPPAVPTYIRLAEEIESNKGSIKLKFVLGFSIFSGQPCDKGGKPYQDFALLVEARNGLMHMRPTEFWGEIKPDGTSEFEPAPIIEKFRSKGILDNSQLDVPFPWHTRIATQAAAYWACNTAADVVHSILKVVPDGPSKLALTALYGQVFKRID